MIYGLYKKYEYNLKFTGIIASTKKELKEYVFKNSLEKNNPLSTFDTYWKDKAQNIYEIKEVKMTARNCEKDKNITIKELYEWAVKNKVENYHLAAQSSSGRVRIHCNSEQLKIQVNNEFFEGVVFF